MRRVRRNPELRPSPWGKQLAKRNFFGQNLSYMDLEGADLRGANLNGADLTGAILAGADLTGANLKGAKLTGADLEGAYLDGADLSGALMKGAVLSDAEMTDVDLRVANLEDVRLTHANLTGAKLYRANLAGADFTGATLEGADFTQARGLDKAEGFTRPNPRNPDATFTVFHADHGVSPAQLDFIKTTLVHEAPQGFFIKEIMLPRSLGMARNALYGPAAGDAPVAESATSYRPRGDRPWSDRVVAWPTRPTDRVQAIGTREGDNFKLFTVYGGYLAPQHPDDPANPNVEAAKRFWSQHALSIEQWDGPKVAKSNSPYPPHVALVHEAARKQGMYLKDPAGREWQGGPNFVVYGLPDAKDLVGGVQVTSNGLLFNGKLHPWGYREGGPRADYNAFFARLAAEHGHARSNPNMLTTKKYRVDRHELRLRGTFRPAPWGDQMPPRNLRGQDLSHMDLRDALLMYADLSHANLSGSDLRGANLFQADLSHANLTQAHLDGAELTKANLSRANLTGAKLPHAYLNGANLVAAKLDLADLSHADLTHALVSHASIFKAKLTGLKGLDTATGIGTLAGLTLVDGLVPKFNPRARHNPFFVSPKGAAVKVSDADFEARNLPRSIEREVEIEGFDPNNLPPGFTVEKDGSHYRVFFQGRDTGLFATDPRKAAEIVSRKGGQVSSGAAPKAAAARPSGTPSDRALFGVGRDELVRRSRAGDSAAADELRLRGRDPLTGVKTEGLASRFSKAVVNGRMRR
jgi:uncharacterized protein YjbI with pentapeptide repeats